MFTRWDWKSYSLTYWSQDKMADIFADNIFLDENLPISNNHYGNKSWGYLIGGRPLWPPAVPRLVACPPSQTPGGLGQRYWSVSAVTWPTKLELRRWGSSGPSSQMISLNLVPQGPTDNTQASRWVSKKKIRFLKRLIFTEKRLRKVFQSQDI